MMRLVPLKEKTQECVPSLTALHPTGTPLTGPKSRLSPDTGSDAIKVELKSLRYGPPTDRSNSLPIFIKRGCY